MNLSTSSSNSHQNDPSTTPLMEPPKIWLYSTTTGTQITWIAHYTPPWSQHSATSGGYLSMLCALSQSQNDSGLEQHCSRKIQQHRNHRQISNSAPKLFRQALWGHHKIPRKWYDPPNPQRHLLSIRAQIKEQSGRISLPQHNISGSQQGPSQAIITQWTSSCQIHNHEKRTS